MKALKEWATVIKALENGNQTVLLRKGGILETSSGFNVESKKFLLFPTYEHQQHDSLKSQFYGYLADVRENQPKAGVNRITSYGEVIEESDVSDMKKIEALSSFHIWSDSYIKERMRWLPQKPMKAIFLKVYKIEQSEVSIIPEYQGCKSWIDINVNVEAGRSVLSDNELNERLERFRKIVN
ncbi:MAG: DUF1802 family protein [Thaumarchaeota archaeon]|nr:DUF1802 family protein [Nitrososphaerota archaeon]